MNNNLELDEFLIRYRKKQILINGFITLGIIIALFIKVIGLRDAGFMLVSINLVWLCSYLIIKYSSNEERRVAVFAKNGPYKKTRNEQK